MPSRSATGITNGTIVLQQDSVPSGMGSLRTAEAGRNRIDAIPWELQRPGEWLPWPVLPEQESLSPPLQEQRELLVLPSLQAQQASLQEQLPPASLQPGLSSPGPSRLLLAFRQLQPVFRRSW